MKSFPAQHFSLGNGEGPRSNDLPLLLRRLADQLEADDIKMEELLDVVISGDEITEHGSWWRATVYWSPDDTPADDPRNTNMSKLIQQIAVD